MTPEQVAKLKEHAQEIAAILYEQTESEQNQYLSRKRKNGARPNTRICSTRNGNFFVREVTGTETGRSRHIKSILGELTVTSQQAQQLEVKPYTQISPYVEKCCIRSSANVSDENAVEDVEFFTGIKVSSKTQQRLVHRQDFPPVELVAISGAQWNKENVPQVLAKRCAYLNGMLTL